MSYQNFTSFKELMDGWLARLKEKKIEHHELFKEGRPNESGICFGHVVAINHCLTELIYLLDYFQKQSHDVHEGLVATYLKYTSDDSYQDETQNDKNIVGKIDEQNHKS
jgi:hypothetical protein